MTKTSNDYASVPVSLQQKELVAGRQRHKWHPKVFASCHTAGPMGDMHRTVLVFRDYCPILPTCMSDLMSKDKRVRIG
jgi:hypothetical protein